MQKRLAEEVTVMVHGRKEFEDAVEASRILFGNNTADILMRLDEKTLLDIFEGVPHFEVARKELEEGIPVLELLAAKTAVFPSKGEARKMIQGGGVSLNKNKISDPALNIDSSFLLNGKYILAQRGKKNYYLIEVSE